MFAASALRTNAGIAARNGIITRPAAPTHEIRASQRAAIETARIRMEAERRRLEEASAHAAKVRIPAPPVIAATIVEVARQHDVSVADLMGPRRFKELVAARQHAIYEIYRRGRSSLPQIGRWMGGRDHTTVLWAVQQWPKKADALGIPCEPMPEIQ